MSFYNITNSIIVDPEVNNGRKNVSIFNCILYEIKSRLEQFIYLHGYIQKTVKLGTSGEYRRLTDIKHFSKKLT